MFLSGASTHAGFLCTDTRRLCVCLQASCSAQLLKKQTQTTKGQPAGLWPEAPMVTNHCPWQYLCFYKNGDSDFRFISVPTSIPVLTEPGGTLGPMVNVHACAYVNEKEKGGQE